MREETKRKLAEWFEAERGENLGNLGADLLLDFLEEQVAWVWYNEGLRDARLQLAKDMDALGEHIELLERLPPAPGRRR